MDGRDLTSSADQTSALPEPSSANGTKPRPALLISHEGLAMDEAVRPA
jgi:hypothetical protein